jgi:hypothetical protein
MVEIAGSGAVTLETLAVLSIFTFPQRRKDG